LDRSRARIAPTVASMMSNLRRWLARRRRGNRPAPAAFRDPFFADPGAVEDDYRRRSAEPPRYPMRDSR
jgi:hypothetical protein